MATPPGFPLTVEQRLQRLEREVVRLVALGRYVGEQLGNDPVANVRCFHCAAQMPQAEVLAHLGVCPNHPMRGVELERDQLKAKIATLTERLEKLRPNWLAGE